MMWGLYGIFLVLGLVIVLIGGLRWYVVFWCWEMDFERDFCGLVSWFKFF